MEIVFKDYNYKNNIINFTIKHNSIIGITGQNLKSIINLVSLKSTGNGNLTINEIKINQDNIKVFRKRICEIGYFIKIF